MDRRLAFGAELVAGAGVHFRVWAPGRARCEVVLEGGAATELAAAADGTFAGAVAGAAEGTLYRYRLDGGILLPDPVSRFQPEGPHGPSQVVDPTRFAWTDAAWPGVRPGGQVIYELHVGTFTREGTYAAAAERLAELRELGVTLVELMPVADFPGRFGWGYDGVNFYAPAHLYGGPDDLRRLVDRAHAEGLAVILDVVYNHAGPDGNYLWEFSRAYFSARHRTEWGDTFNYDERPAADFVRDFVAGNAAYWIDEYHFDGLRLDAVHAIVDDSEDHILALIGRRARAAARGRAIFIAAEDESQLARIVRPPEAGGYGLDAIWDDDFHHAARVAATGRREAFYSDYLGTPQELVSLAKHGFLYQGQRSSFREKRRGSPALDLRGEHHVVYLENHDQIANTAGGRHLAALADPGRLRALTAFLLLSPGTPLLFQGQEFAASAPFLYFADHGGTLGEQVAAGRAQFMSQFASIATARETLADPCDPATFERCKLDWSERSARPEVVALHRDLIALRRAGRVDGAVLGPEAFVLRWLDPPARLLVVNLGVNLWLPQAAEPLLAPPEAAPWSLVFSTEDPRYGGAGTPPLDDDAHGWRLPAHAAVVLQSPI